MRKKNNKPINAEKLSSIAEHGIGKLHLSNKEWRWLEQEGYEELLHLKNLQPLLNEQLPINLLNTALEKFFPYNTAEISTPLHIRCIKGIMELIELPPEWTSGSPAFAWRDAQEKEKRLAFQHHEKDSTVHIELVSNLNETIDISVRCNDDAGSPILPMTVDLICEGRCVESVSTNDKGPLTIKNVERGPMQLCVHSTQGACIKIDLRVD
jgi:hypothetical protein